MSGAATRACWVDCSRTLAMFCIVWLHANAAPGGLGHVVGGAIALFFLLAGYFLPAEAEKVLHRTVRLALAWLMWSLLSLGFMAAAAPDFEFSWQRCIGWGVAAYNTPLWFLRTLIFYQLLVAGMLALRLLPRFGWVLVAVFMLCSYTTAPAQYAAVRFDYFWFFLLGYALRPAPLACIHGWLKRNALALLSAVLICLSQPHILAWFAAWAELPWRHCSLPVGAMGWGVLMVLAGIFWARYLQRSAALLAFCGRWMLFIYAAHSFVLAPLYGGYNPHFLWNIWVPLLVIPLLAGGGWWLTRLFPCCMALFLARQMRPSNGKPGE